MPKTFIRNLTSPTRTKRTDMQLGIVLAFVAGAINAGGLLAVGTYTSHMTGIVSSIADALALYQWHMAVMATAFLFSFTAGAIISCLIINAARARKLSSEFAFALMLEALLMVAFGLSAGEWHSFTLSIVVTICLLCFIMGLQNAIITKISHAEVRTTHVTGLVTDIGIEIGRYIYSGIARNNAITLYPDKLKLHSSLLGAFLLGGIIGAFAFNLAGFVMTLPLAFLLAFMAAVPLIDDLTRNKGSK
jgi:uncharacterized membrane protein YoaK (UPF0700 family)